LWGDPVIGIKPDKGEWTPSGRAAEYRKRWNTRWVKNEKKIRLSSELLPGTGLVDLTVTDYSSYIVTNQLMYKSLWEHHVEVLAFKDVGLRNGRIRPLGDSKCSNHLGGDILVVGPGEIYFQSQGAGVHVDALRWKPTASGSFDVDDMSGATDLLTVVKRGLARELAEETQLLQSASVDLRGRLQDIKIIGYSRASYMGGKPQFYAVARIAEKLEPKVRRSEKNYVHGFTVVEFDPNGEEQGILDATRSFEEVHGANFSPSLKGLLFALESWLRPQEHSDETSPAGSQPT
jgi:hypothetical protein